MYEYHKHTDDNNHNNQSKVDKKFLDLLYEFIQSVQSQIDIMLPASASLQFLSYYKISGYRSLLAWVHLIGMNVGGASVTVTMIVAGLIGSGVYELVASGSVTNQLKPNTAVMAQFILPISVFAAVLVVGIIAGGIVFITNYFRMKNSGDRIDGIRRCINCQIIKSSVRKFI
jgi:hypothetical protein